MKACFKCEAVKPLSEFYKHPKMSDGHLGKCKDCAKKDAKYFYSLASSDPMRSERERERCRAKMRCYRSLGKDKTSQAQKTVYNRAWMDRFPEKRKAQILVRTAIRSGIIKKNPCEICGCNDSEAHHEDYSKPLDVNWLCDTHHKQRHVQIRVERRLNEARNAEATRQPNSLVNSV